MQAAFLGDSWRAIWQDAANAILDENGGEDALIPYRDIPPPIEDADGIAPITYAQAEALNAAWTDAARKAGVRWTPVALGESPSPDAWIPVDIAARWWASTAQLALELDRVGTPIAPIAPPWRAPAAAPPAAAATTTIEPSTERRDTLIALALVTGVVVGAVYIARRRRASRRRDRAA